MSIGHLAARRGEQMGGLSIGERLAAALLPLIGQHFFHSSLLISLPHIANGLVGDSKGFDDLVIAPTFAAFEQHVGTGHGACIRFAASHKHF